MSFVRSRMRGVVVAVATVVATTTAVLIGSPALAAPTATVVRQPHAPGVLVYGIQVTVVFDQPAPTTQFRLEFDLPADQQVVVMWSQLPFKRSGNHWTADYYSPTGVSAGTRLTTSALIYGLGDPTNCRFNGSPCAYTVLTDTVPPTVPGNVTATRPTVTTPPWPGSGGGGGTGYVTVRWEASTDNFAVTGYEISVNGQVIGTQLSPLYIYVPSLTVTATYAVRAYDRVGNYSGYGTFVLPPA